MVRTMRGRRFRTALDCDLFHLSTGSLTLQCVFYDGASSSLLTDGFNTMHEVIV
jgi:hypothetical protein